MATARFGSKVVRRRSEGEDPEFERAPTKRIAMQTVPPTTERIVASARNCRMMLKWISPPRVEHHVVP
jgi:hypothetical protein